LRRVWRRWQDAWSPARGNAFVRDAARFFIRAFRQEQENNGQIFGLLAEGLAAVAGPMEPAEAARVCAEAAPLLTQALAKEKDANVRLQLATGLTIVAGRLEPAEAARLLNQALAHENDADVPVVPGRPGGMPGVNASPLAAGRWPDRGGGASGAGRGHPRGCGKRPGC